MLYYYSPTYSTLFNSLPYSHYWKTVLCQVPETLPSAFYRGTRQSNILPSAALGKIKHSAKVALPSARHSAKPGSRQIWALPSAAALGKSPTRQKVAGT